MTITKSEQLKPPHVSVQHSNDILHSISNDVSNGSAVFAQARLCSPQSQTNGQTYSMHRYIYNARSRQARRLKSDSQCDISSTVRIYVQRAGDAA